MLTAISQKLNRGPGKNKCFLQAVASGGSHPEMLIISHVRCRPSIQKDGAAPGEWSATHPRTLGGTVSAGAPTSAARLQRLKSGDHATKVYILIAHIL